MRNLFRLSVLVLGLAAVVPAAHAREVVRKGDTVIVALSGEISPPLHLFLRRAGKAAENARASADIIHKNTYGGRPAAAARTISVLNRHPTPPLTILYSTL